MDLFPGHTGGGERSICRLDHGRGSAHIDIGAFVEHLHFGRGEIDGVARGACPPWIWLPDQGVGPKSGIDSASSRSSSCAKISV